MNTRMKEYILPEGAGPQAIKSLLAARCRFVEEPVERVRRAFFDGFDWGAYRAGGAVEEQDAEGGRRLVWQDLGETGTALVEPIEHPPAFAGDLPPGPMREKLAAALGPRRLLPLLALHSELQTVRLLNEDDKTVARLIIAESRLEPNGEAAPQGLAPRLQLVSLKGYEEAFDEVDTLLREELGLAPAQTPLLREALAALGRRPVDYSSKIDYRLEADARADATAKKILLGLLDTLEANIEGTRANLDPEFLHDLRVATRRTRSALGQIKRVFPPAVVAHYKERFAWVQAITGKMRDLDVYLLGFDGYQRCLPAQLRPHLEPLRAYLLAHHAEEQQALAEALDSPQFRTLLREWRAFLRSPPADDPQAANARRPAKAVADACIWRLVRRVRREGSAISAESPSEEVHELRKSCKKMRYLMEFFQSLYPSEEIRGLIKQVKALLDNLGEFQDYSVQSHHLTEIAQRMRAEGDTPTETLLAMGALVGDILTRQARARAAFAELFAAYDAPDNCRRFKALFHHKGHKDDSG